MLLAGELRSRSSSCSEEEVLAVSESAGRMRYRQLCELQPAVNNGVISHGPTLWAYCSSCCHLTWPDICSPDTSRENNRRVHLSLVCPRRGLVTGACVQEEGKCPVQVPTVQSLRHALRVNRHTRPSALVDQAGSPCHAYRVYRPTFYIPRSSSILSCCLPAALSQSHWATPAT